MILRLTKSVCPKCLIEVNAKIIEQDHKIIMLKNCNKHGNFKVPLSNNVKHYKELDFLIESINKNKKKIKKRLKKEINSFFIYLTSECNLNCPICFTNANKKHIKEPTLKDISKRLKQLKNKRINLFGGEPTIRKDILEIIKLIKDSGNTPILFTNGIKTANFSYLKKLKDAGLKGIHLQFDGFDEQTYRKFRGKNIFKNKMKSLKNIKKLQLPLALEVTIYKNINDNEIKKIMTLVHKDNIRLVLFRSCKPLGKNKSRSKNYGLTDDLILKYSKNSHINLYDVLNFQKFFYCLSSIFNKEDTFNHLNDSWFLIYKNRPITKIYDFKKIDNNLSKFVTINNNWLRLIYLVLISLKLLTKKNINSSILLSTTLLRVLIKKTNNLLNISKDIIFINFGSLSDRFDFDKQRMEETGYVLLGNKIVNFTEFNIMREVKYNINSY